MSREPYGRLPHGTSDDRTSRADPGLEPLDRDPRGPRTQPAQRRCPYPAGRDDLHHGRQRLGQVVAGPWNPLSGPAAPALRFGSQTGRFRRPGGRCGAAPLGRDGRSEPHRQILALESRNLYQGLRRDPQAFSDQPYAQHTGLGARPSFNIAGGRCESARARAPSRSRCSSWPTSSWSARRAVANASATRCSR